MSRYEVYKIRRYCLSLTSFSGIVAGASHWWCRVKWEDDDGNYHEEEAERGRGDDRTGRFNTRNAAQAAGLRLAKRIAKRDDQTYYVVTDGGWGYIDPAQTLHAPGNLKERLNALWHRFENLDGWEAPKDKHPKVQKICDRWSELVKGP